MVPVAMLFIYLFCILPTGLGNLIFGLINNTYAIKLDDNGNPKRYSYIETQNLTPCVHGMYTADNGGYICDCDEGYTGFNCEVAINECKTLEPCTVSTTCIDAHNVSIAQFNLGINCSCPQVDGWNCSREDNPCIPNPCDRRNCSTRYMCTNSSKHGTMGNDIANQEIIFPVVGVLALIGIIVIAVFVVRYCRNKSGMEGTYNPNRQEQITGTVEMATPKKPNLERMI